MRLLVAAMLMMAGIAQAEDIRFIVMHRSGLLSYQVEVEPFATPDCQRCTRFQVIKTFFTVDDPGWKHYSVVKENLTATQATALVDALEAGVIADEYVASGI